MRVFPVGISASRWSPCACCGETVIERNGPTMRAAATEKLQLTRMYPPSEWPCRTCPQPIDDGGDLKMPLVPHGTRHRRCEDLPRHGSRAPRAAVSPA